jgi:putative transposase
MSVRERRALVDRDDPDLPVAAQCRLLKLARSTLYYQPAPVDADDLALMRRMDELSRSGRSPARGGWWRHCAKTAAP